MSIEPTGEPRFVKASGDRADPVGSIGADWGFWDETWSHWYGGYDDEGGARDACREYADRL